MQKLSTTVESLQPASEVSMIDTSTDCAPAGIVITKGLLEDATTWSNKLVAPSSTNIWRLAEQKASQDNAISVSEFLTPGLSLILKDSNGTVIQTKSSTGNTVVFTGLTIGTYTVEGIVAGCEITGTSKSKSIAIPVECLDCNTITSTIDTSAYCDGSNLLTYNVAAPSNLYNGGQVVVELQELGVTVSGSERIFTADGSVSLNLVLTAGNTYTLVTTYVIGTAVLCTLSSTFEAPDCSCTLTSGGVSINVNTNMDGLNISFPAGESITGIISAKVLNANEECNCDNGGSYSLYDTFTNSDGSYNFLFSEIKL